MQLPASSGASSVPGGGRSVRPTGTPAMVRCGDVPKFVRSSTPTVKPPPTCREAVPMPPFHPKQIIPAPAPTAPSSTGPDPAPRTAVRTSSAEICVRRASLSHESSHSPTMGMTTLSMPRRGSTSQSSSISPSHARPTCMVEVSTMGVSSHPELAHLDGRRELSGAVEHRHPAPERLGHHACGRAGDDGRHACAGDPSAGRGIGLVAPHRRVTDQDAGHVGDGVGGPGRQHADGDAQVARAGAGGWRCGRRHAIDRTPLPSARGVRYGPGG